MSCQGFLGAVAGGAAGAAGGSQRRGLAAGHKGRDERFRGKDTSFLSRAFGRLFHVMMRMR